MTTSVLRVAFLAFVLSAGAGLARAPLASALERGGTVDVNRPRTPFDCDLPIGRDWYGSTERCLQELCAGENVFNETIFDNAGRRRKNPCYGQSPSEVPN